MVYYKKFTEHKNWTNFLRNEGIQLGIDEIDMRKIII